VVDDFGLKLEKKEEKKQFCSKPEKNQLSGCSLAS